MKITSSFKNDIWTEKPQPGGYEWWYFDAIDMQSTYRFVVIFYEGNPFSTRYNRHLRKHDSSVKILPAQYPAVSISVYKGNKTIYYSFTELSETEVEFCAEQPFLRLGNHEMYGTVSEQYLTYSLRLNEKLPSGNAIEATIRFRSPHMVESLYEDMEEEDRNVEHSWNLSQPKAAVEGNITVMAKGREPEIINFFGEGYHDHNIGFEPMNKEFRKWYWGRFHFEKGTLVYYVMDRLHSEQYHAWLISNDNKQILYKFDDISLQDNGITLFGLKSSRRILIGNEEVQVTIQQSVVLDNGPFYQRFSSEAFLNIPEEQIVESCQGITEFLYPPRIRQRLFWPLVNMRIFYSKEGPHWVQSSQKLYRWIW